MPELPEVETTRRDLESCTQKQKIKAFESLWPKKINLPHGEFKTRIAGKTILNWQRRAKYLVAELSDQEFLIVHLRMSGRFLYQARKDVSEYLPPHTRAVFTLSKGNLYFIDIRKFGHIWLTTQPETILGKLGVEPFSAEFTPQVLHKLLGQTKKSLKNFLLDQHYVAGIGNIYADEASFWAKLHPLTLTSSITPKQAQKLGEAIQKVLRWGLETKGASFDHAYLGGEFQNHFQVYGRHGENCRTCKNVIQQIKVGQRSTHFCPQCQRPKN